MWLHEFVARGDYNEPEILKEYVRHNCGHLMTEFERVAEKAVASRNADLIASVRALLKESYTREDPAVVKALDYGHEQFMQAVVNRIAGSDRAQQEICRCPKCDKIAATPKAHQCLWCKADWHEHHAAPAASRERS